MNDSIHRVSFPSDTHTFPMHLNGRLTYVTAPISISVPEAIKAIQDAEEANQVLVRPTAGLVYHSDREALVVLEDIMHIIGVQDAPMPAPKPKRHDWYKFNQRNKYGR